MENFIYLIFAVVAVLELVILGIVTGKKARLFSAGFLLVLLMYIHGAYLFLSPGVMSGAVMLVGLFRAFNIMRFGYGRMQPDYLKISAFRTSWRLMLIQASSFLAVQALLQSELARLLACIAITVFSCIVFLQTGRRLSKIDLSEVARPQPTKDLPVVSVCIPARNETSDLENCLNLVVGSDYPKLEILVLDDCSQDKTPEIIKRFAHNGVRFISGSEPGAGWLSKNAAYQKLYDEATGDYLLFCGVDLRFEASAISSMMAIMQKRKLEMINILPKRDKAMRYALFFQSARYLWELALPRQIIHRPPALSSCWIIKRTLLNPSAFEGLPRSALPESHFAAKADKRNAYSFLSARNLAMVYSHKTLSEQRSTALRLRYPQLRKRPENVLIYLLLALSVVFFPAIILGLALASRIGIEYIFLAVAAIILLNMTNALVTSVVSRPHVFIAAFIFPLVILLDICTLLVSMWRYEFGLIDWKGRNVCLPVMHVTSKLPQVS